MWSWWHRADKIGWEWIGLRWQLNRPISITLVLKISLMDVPCFKESKKATLKKRKLFLCFVFESKNQAYDIAANLYNLDENPQPWLFEGPDGRNCWPISHIEADDSFDMLFKLASMMMMMMMMMMIMMLGKLLRRVGGWVTSHNRAASRVQDTLGGDLFSSTLLLCYLCCTFSGKS